MVFITRIMTHMMGLEAPLEAIQVVMEVAVSRKRDVFDQK